MSAQQKHTNNILIQHNKRKYRYWKMAKHTQKKMQKMYCKREARSLDTAQVFM